MKIKRIIARDMREAMRQVRQLFGDDAVILSNRACPEGVELVAAIDFDAQAIQRSAARQAPHRVAGASPTVAAGAPFAPPQTVPLMAKIDMTMAEKPLTEKFLAEQPMAEQPPSQQKPWQASVESSLPPPASRVAPAPSAFADVWAEFQSGSVEHSAAGFGYTPTNAAGAKAGWADTGFDIAYGADFGAGAASAQSQTEPLGELQREVSLLRDLFERQLNVLEWHKYNAAHPVELETRERLHNLGLPSGLAKSLAQAAAKQEPTRALSAALRALSQQIQTTGQAQFNQGGVFAFIGPTGVGKTTTLAKIAAQSVLSHGRDSVALITTDRFRIGAQEQLRNYARILNIPLHVARDELHLGEVLAAVSDRRLVLIDTAGMSPRDTQMMRVLHKMPSFERKVNLLLVLSAQAQYSAMVDAINRFQSLPLAGMVLTKLDETLLLGNALAALIHSGLPLVCTGVGQRVPEDLWYPNRADLIKQALELGQGEWARMEAELSTSGYGQQKVGASWG